MGLMRKDDEYFREWPDRLVPHRCNSCQSLLEDVFVYYNFSPPNYANKYDDISDAVEICLCAPCAKRIGDNLSADGLILEWGKRGLVDRWLKVIKGGG